MWIYAGVPQIHFASLLRCPNFFFRNRNSVVVVVAVVIIIILYCERWECFRITRGTNLRNLGIIGQQIFEFLNVNPAQLAFRLNTY